MLPPITVSALRAYAVTRSLFEPSTLARAIDQLGFVQADPIRAPARAQDLALRHRVVGYRAGDLERQYASLAIDEDFFVNYGFLPSRHLALMHPRTARRPWDRTSKRRAGLVLDFIRARGEVHPREVDAHFEHGTVTNYWGGSSNATTHLLDGMHYRGMLRVVRRERGIRVYAVRVETPREASLESPRARADALVRLAIAKYAPVPGASLNQLVIKLRAIAAPQLDSELKAAAKRARVEAAHARVEGVDWYWPAGETPAAAGDPDADRVRFLAPFDPVVWDRRRFEVFWGWAYRFEAYTPVAKRKLGYYALPLLWRDQVIGWGNLAAKGGELEAEIGYVKGKAPRDRAFRRELEAEIERIRTFLQPASTQ